MVEAPQTPPAPFRNGRGPRGPVGLEHASDARPCEYVTARVPCAEPTTLRLDGLDGPRPLCLRHGELVIAARCERAAARALGGRS